MEKEPAPAPAPATPLRTTFCLHNLPTSPIGLVVGDIWNNRGVLNIVS